MKIVSYKLLAVTLVSFVLGACGGGSDGDDEKGIAEMTYEEVVASYENSNFPVSGEGSLDGVWVAVYNVESSVRIGSSAVGDSGVERIEIEIWSIKENLADGTLMIDECSTEPTNGISYDVTMGEDGIRDNLSVRGSEAGTIDSPTKISMLGEPSELSVSAFLDMPIAIFGGIDIGMGFEIKPGTLIKISDTYKESIGTITVDGESRDSPCFAIEHAVEIEEVIIEGDEVSNSTTERVHVIFNEEDFIKGEIYDTISGSGDYEDYFEAEFYVYNPEEFIDSEGSDGEAGYLELSEDGLMTFSGESEVILRFGGAINISFDFNLL